ncbi:MAG: flagellar export protein FliJ [Candidatus Nealsonbacteria bacterium]|nr:flagellar export protein FliJ [Candidatus Nealsonbacteria bacterium]
MSKFKFRLATLLRLREETRDERRAELAEAYRVDDLLQQQLEQMDQQRRTLVERCRKAVGPGSVDVDLLVEAQRFDLTLKAHRKQLEGQREQVAVEIERRREVLVAANREVRVLEKLREKQSQRHREEENRREAKQLDEAAVLTVAREMVR